MKTLVSTDPGNPVVTGTLQYVKNGVTATVTEDTATPANNIPLPVKLMGVSGALTLTTDQLNVQTTHTGASPDSTQIGDGADLLSITAAGEAMVNVGASVLPTGAATSAKQDSVITLFNTLNAKSASSAVTLAFDYIATTYVGATTDISTVVYKTGGAGGTTVATLTMGYDGSNRLITVTKTQVTNVNKYKTSL